MATEIDSLQLKIESDASKAASELDKLASSMEKLASSFAPGKIRNISSAAESISALSKVKIDSGTVSGIVSLGNSLSSLTKTAGQANNLSKLSGTLTTLMNTLGSMDTSSITESLPTIANSISGFSTAVNGADTATAASSIKTMAGGLEQLSGLLAGADFSGLIELGANIHVFAEKLSELDTEKLSLLSKYVEAAQKLGSSGSSAVDISAFSSSTFGEEETKGSYASVDSSGLERLSSAMGAASTKTSEWAKSLNTSGLISGLKGVKKVIDGLLSPVKKLGSAFKQMAAKYITSLGSGIKNLKAKLDKLYKSIVKIVTYRAIRKLMSEMTSAFKDGIEYLYQYSKAMDTTFASSMDAIATDVLYLKNSLAAMAEPLINAVIPAVDAVTDAFAGLFNTISKIIAMLTGAETYTVANKIATEYAESTEDAEDSLDELKRYTLGFDELNVLGENDSDSSSSDSDSTDYSVYFDTVALDSSISSLYDLGSSISEALTAAMKSIDWDSIYEKAINFGTGLAEFLNGLIDVDLFVAMGETIASGLNTILYALLAFSEEFDFANLGTAINQGIIAALQTFDFDALLQCAKSWGTGVAELINGIITPELFAEVGSALANALNAAVLYAFTLGTTIDWENIGLSIATGVNTFFETFDFETLAGTINAWVGGIWTMIKTAVENIDWGEVWSGITEFFGSLDTGITDVLTLAAAIAAIGAAISAVIGIAKGLGTVSSLFKGVQTAIEAFNLPVKSASTLLGGIALIIAGVAAAVTGFVSMWVSGFSWIKEAIMLVGIALVAVGLIVLGVAAWPVVIVAAIVAALATIVILIKDNWEAIKEFFINLWEKVKEIFLGFIDNVKNNFQNFRDWVLGMIDKIKNGFSNMWSSITNGVKTAVSAVTNFFSNLWSSITNGISNLWNTVVGWIQNAITWIKEKVTAVMDTVVNIIKNLPENIKNILTKFTTWLRNLWEGIKEFMIELPTNIKDKIVSIFTFLKDKIVSIFTTVKTWLKNAWTNIKEFMIELPTNIKDKIVTIFTTLKDKIVSIFTTAKEKIKSIWNAIKEWLLSVVTAIKDFYVSYFTAIKNTVVNIFTTVKTKIKEIWNAIKEWIVNKITAIKESFITIFTAIKDKIVSLFTTVKTSIITIWTSIKEWLVNIVTTIKTSIVEKFNAVKTGIIDAFTKVKTKISDIWNAIWTTIKNIINKILSGVETWINAIIGSINTLLSGINKMVNAVGSAINSLFGTDIGEISLQISEVSLPRLATGAIIPPNDEFIAVLGDQTSGTNIEAPESLIRQIMQEELNSTQTSYADNSGVISAVSAASANESALLKEQNSLLRDLLESGLTANITTSQITSAFKRQNQRAGKTIIAVGT